MLAGRISCEIIVKVTFVIIASLPGFRHTVYFAVTGA